MTLDEIGIFLIGCGVGGLLVLAYVWPCIPPRKAEPPPHPHESVSDAPPGSATGPVDNPNAQSSQHPPRRSARYQPASPHYAFVR
jgi:hypothetical protein